MSPDLPPQAETSTSFAGRSRSWGVVLRAYHSLNLFWRTVLDALAVYGVEHLIPHGLPRRFLTDSSGEHQYLTSAINTGDRQAILHAIAFTALISIVVAPVLEEPINRGLPILLARRLSRGFDERGRKIVVGLIASAATVLFSWLHNPVAWALPLSQLLFGAVAWRVAWGRGLRYSVLLHFLNNLLVTGFVSYHMFRIAFSAL